jgi:hypothetical protein
MRRDIETRFKPKPDSLARVAVSTNLPKDVDVLVRKLPNRSEWLRRVITEAARKELFNPSDEVTA